MQIKKLSVDYIKGIRLPVNNTLSSLELCSKIVTKFGEKWLRITVFLKLQSMWPGNYKIYLNWKHFLLYIRRKEFPRAVFSKIFIVQDGHCYENIEQNNSNYVTSTSKSTINLERVRKIIRSSSEKTNDGRDLFMIRSCSWDHIKFYQFWPKTSYLNNYWWMSYQLVGVAFRPRVHKATKFSYQPYSEEKSSAVNCLEIIFSHIMRQIWIRAFTCLILGV